MSLCPVPVYAQAMSPPATPAPSAFDQGAADVLALLQGKAEAANVFNPAFLTAVPPDQLATVLASLKAQFGEAQAVTAVRGPQTRVTACARW